MTKPPKRPRDPNQLAKLIVDIASGAAEDAPAAKDSAAAELGRQGGKKGTHTCVSPFSDSWLYCPLFLLLGTALSAVASGY